MNRLLFSSFCILHFSLVAATLTVPVADLGQVNVNNRRLTLTSTDSPRQSGAALITVEPKTQFTGTNGTATFTNVLWGNYRLDIAGTPGTAFRFFVPDTNATLSVLTLITNSTAPTPPTNFWTAAQTAAAIAANGGAGAIPTNNGTGFNLTIIDQLTIGTGENAVTLTTNTAGGVTADASISFSNVTARSASISNLTVTGTITFGGSTSNQWPSGGGSGSGGITGIVSTPEVVLLSTNNVYITGTNLLVLGVVSNFTRAVLTLPYTNSFTEGSIPPLPNYSVKTSTNGVDFETAEAAYTVPTWIALYDANGTSSIGYASNITVYGYTNVLLVGNTIDLFGQNLLVDTATNSRGAVNKEQAEAIAATAASSLPNWSITAASQRPSFAGFGLNWSAKWQTWHTSATNQSTLHFGPYGDSLFSLTANDVQTTNSSGGLVISEAYLSGTNIVLVVSVTNVVAALVPQQNTNNLATNGWYDVPIYTSTYPNQTNGEYLLTFPVPTWTNATTYRVRSLITTTNAYSTVRRMLVRGDLTVGGGAEVTNGNWRVTIPDDGAALVVSNIIDGGWYQFGTDGVLGIGYGGTAGVTINGESGNVSWNGVASGSAAGLTNFALVARTNHIPLYAEYANTSASGLSTVFSTGMRARQTEAQTWSISIPAPTGYRTNITRLFYVATNAATAPATIQLGIALNGPAGTLVGSVTNQSRAITLATLGQTNIVAANFTNTTGTAWTQPIQNLNILPSSVVGNSYFIGGVQEWYP